MDKDFNKVFNECPSCGGSIRFLEELGKELKKRGLARQDWNMRYDVRRGPVMDSSRAMLMPIGVSVPGFSISTDICMNCGTVYAVELRRTEAVLQARPMEKKRPQNFSSS